MYFSFVFFFFVLSQSMSATILDCPIENGKISSTIAPYVRGEGNNKRISIIGKNGSLVKSISDGKIKSIGKRSKSIFISQGDLVYIYSGVNERIEEGQFIAQGDILGTLDGSLLGLTIKKDGKTVDASYYIDCFDSKN